MNEWDVKLNSLTHPKTFAKMGTLAGFGMAKGW